MDTNSANFTAAAFVTVAQAAVGKKASAAACLDQVIAFFVSLRRPDRPIEYPVLTAVTRAALHEEDLVVATIDTERVRHARVTNPVLRDEKLDLSIREMQRILGVEREG